MISQVFKFPFVSDISQLAIFAFVTVSIQFIPPAFQTAWSVYHRRMILNIYRMVNKNVDK